MSKEPDKRFGSMEEFANLVGGERGARTVISAPIKPAAKASLTRVPGAKRSNKLVRRGVLVAGLCAIIGGAAWAGLQQEPSGSEAAPIEAETSAPSTAVPAVPMPVSKPEQRPAESDPPDAGPAEMERTPSKPKPAPKQYALLTVASEPWGTLYIDGLEIGPTPVADHRLELGTYRIRIEQEGFRTKTETITVRGPNPIRRRYILEPAGPE